MKRFVLFRFSATEAGKEINTIEETQLLFVVKNLLLAKGYECVETRDSADFVVGINYTNEYKESYIPPRQVTVPRYIPGGTSQTYSNFSGYAGSNYVWGTGRSTTYHPGTWTSDTVSVGGYNIGFFYPSLRVTVVDAETFSEFWRGSIVGSSKTSDVRLTGQFLLANLVGNEFPNRTRSEDRSHGFLGISFMCFSRDGNTFYPTVMELSDKGPAKRAGIKQFDQIVSLNGTSTANTTILEFREMFGKPGEMVQLQIARENKVVDKTVVLAERIME